MKRRIRPGTYFPAMALALFIILGGSLSAHALPTGALIFGEIERMGVDNVNDVWSKGWIVVGKDNVIIPRNLLIELPANRLTLQQLFVPTPGNPVSGPPAACFANGESGLAKADRCNARVLGANVTIYANRMDSGHVIAGDVRLAKAIESVTGTITYINYTDGYFRVNGIHNPGTVDDNTGVMIRFNDPGPLGNPGFGRHTIQRGLGCLPGSLNCSADPRFTNDPENYTLTFQTGFPLCIPSTANGLGDPNCPHTNRPTPVVSPPVTNPPGATVFPFISPQAVVGGTVDNSAHFAPILLGDSITVFGNFELIPDSFIGAQFFSAHTAQVLADLATRDDPTQPDYTILREVGWDSPPFPAARIRLLFIGNSTLHGLTLGGKGAVTDPDTAVDIYASHYDQSNVAHNSPGDGIPVYSTAGFKKGAVAFGGVSGGMFQIHPGLQVELDPALLDKKALLDPCSSLSSAIDNVTNPGPAPPPLFVADVRAGVGANCQLTAIPPITSLLTGQPAVDEAYKFVAPIAKEGVAYTRHKQRNPGLASFDKNGNPTPNGQYLSPIPTTWAGYEDINIGLMQAPWAFSGIPWLLDRRVGPSGCIGPCEGTPQPLTPFPFEGFNPSAVALRPSVANAAFGVPQPDLGRIFQFWPFGPTHQLAWDNAALTALATTGLPAITPVPNLAFQVTVLPPPPVTGVTLTASPASPQYAGTSVLWTAVASGGSGTYEYQFSDNVSGVLTVVQPYGPSPGFVWNTTGRAPPPTTYTFQVDARSAGSVNASEAAAAASYLIKTPLPIPATAVTLAALPVGTALVGDNVVFTALASGGSGSYQYQFMKKLATDNLFVVAQAYGPGATWTWNTTGSPPGAYEVQVLARSGGSIAPQEAINSLVYTLTVLPATGATLTPAPPSPVTVGDNVVFTGAATGGTGTYQYQFWYRSVGAATFFMVQDYGVGNTFTWRTATEAVGSYEWQVFARSSGSTAASEAVSPIVPFVVNAPPVAATTSVTLIPPQPASPQFVGTPVTWTAFASGGTGNYEYKFWTLNSASGVVTMVKDYTVPGNSYAWNTTGLPPGAIHYVAVWARSAGSTAGAEATAGWDGPYELKANIPAVTGVTMNAPSPLSPQSPPYTSVVWTALASGGSGTYEYQFWTLNNTTGVAAMVKDYTVPGNSYTWDPSTLAPGAYSVAAKARSAGSASAAEATTAWVTYVLQ